jgi:hypothetical protein
MWRGHISPERAADLVIEIMAVESADECIARLKANLEDYPRIRNDVTGLAPSFWAIFNDYSLVKRHHSSLFQSLERLSQTVDTPYPPDVLGDQVYASLNDLYVVEESSKSILSASMRTNLLLMVYKEANIPLEHFSLVHAQPEDVEARPWFWIMLLWQFCRTRHQYSDLMDVLAGRIWIALHTQATTRRLQQAICMHRNHVQQSMDKFAARHVVYERLVTTVLNSVGGMIISSVWAKLRPW